MGASAPSGLGARLIRIAILAALIVAALFATDARQHAGRAFYEAGLPRVAALMLGGPAWRGAALYERGRYEEAAQAFRAAEFPGQLYDLGTALARSGRLREAAQTFDDALERDPNDEDARYNLAVVESLLAKRRADAVDARNGANASASANKRGGEAPSDAENEINSTGEGAAGDRDSGRQANSAGRSRVFKSGRAPQSGDPSENTKASGSIGSAAGLGRTGESAMNVARPPEQPALRSESMMLKTIFASRQWLETLPDDPGVYVRKLFVQQREARRERGMAAPEVTDQW
ncbi:hypothetical protein GCM10008179_19670 [Hansschlegelia plantiphila]|uniref:Tetratricopeptide repeat protein n=1 Tax=Hansschlegelia plantiphila TaxID=374655 RepID=A0A9W6J2S5_9HYPH|nr:hypothetical protein GCM10008179_19670 [Hansschlegelia plantiphila]